MDLEAFFAQKQGNIKCHKVLDAMPDIIGIQKPDHTMLHYNKAGLDFLNMDPEAVRGKKCFQLIGRSKPCEPCATAKAINSKKMQKLERYVPETQTYIEVTASPILNTHGNVELIVEQLRDVTQRKLMEKELQESEEKFRAISESALDAIVMIDENAGVTYWNPAAEKMFGFSQHEVLGKDPHDLIMPEKYRPAYLEGFSEFIKSDPQNKIVHGRVVGEVLELSALHKDGQEFPIEISVAPIWLEDSIGAVAVIRDVSERKKAEQEIKRYMTTLEEKNAEIQSLYKEMNQEIEKAKRVHERTFLAEPPVLENVSLTAHFYPAKRLGGDFYNFLLKGNQLLFYLSDVSGHGLDSTIISVFVKETIENYVSLKPDALAPDAILRHINQQYHQDHYPEDYFVSIFLAVLDVDTGALSYANAGIQFPPLLAFNEGEPFELVEKVPPISRAIPPELMNFNGAQIKLAPGATLFCYTDGIAEQGAPDHPYGERLKHLFYQHSHSPVEQIKASINADFKTFNHGSLQGEDDITYILLKFHPSTQPPS